MSLRSSVLYTTRGCGCRHRDPGQARTGLAWLRREWSGLSAMLTPGNRSSLGPPSRSVHVTRSVPCPTCLVQAPDADQAEYPGGAWEDSRAKGREVSGCLGFGLGKWLALPRWKHPPPQSQGARHGVPLPRACR